MVSHGRCLIGIWSIALFGAVLGLLGGPLLDVFPVPEPVEPTIDGSLRHPPMPFITATAACRRHDRIAIILDRA